MRAFVLALVLLGTASGTQAYSAYQRPTSTSSCCDLSPWAYEHMDAVRLMAERVRRYYNSRSRGGGFPRTYTHEWSDTLIEATGKTDEEIDIVARRLCDNIITDMQSGRLTYGVIAQPNYFESQAAAALEKLIDEAKTTGKPHQDEPGVSPGLGTTDQSTGKNNNTGTNQSDFAGNVNWTKDDPWKRDERERLFWILTKSSVSIRNLQNWQWNQKERLTNLALRLNKTLDEINAWQKQELELFKSVVYQYSNVSSDLKQWQKTERGRIDWLILQNEFTHEDLDRWQRKNLPRLKSLARQYRIHIEELKVFQRRELERLHVILNHHNSQRSRDILKVFENEERNRFNHVLSKHNATINELQEQIRRDKDRCKQQAEQYQRKVETMEKIFDEERNSLTAVIKQQQELKRMTDWQLSERKRLEDVIRVMIEKWLSEESLRLRNQGAFSYDQNLTMWQQQERIRLMAIAQSNKLSIDEFQKKIASDQSRLHALANTHQVRLEEIEEWLKKELLRLQSQGLMKTEEDADNHKEWQNIERERLQKLVNQTGFTIDEFSQKLNDRGYLQQLATEYNEEVEEVEQFIRNEFQRLRDQRKPEIENPAQWQQEVRRGLEEIIKQQNVFNIEELEALIKVNRGQLQKLGNQFQIPVDEVEQWFRKDLLRLQNQGDVRIENLVDWQLKERQALEQLIQQNSNLTVVELEQQLASDKSRLQQLARQNRIGIKEYEKWIKRELIRLENEGRLEYERIPAWQQAETERIFRLAAEQNKSMLTDIVQKLLADRLRLENLSREHHVSIQELEQWLSSEAKNLLQRGIIGELKDWQRAERLRIQNLVRNQNLTVEQFQQQLKNDSGRLQNLAWQHQVDVEDVEEWISLEVIRQIKPAPLAAWQQHEQQRLQTLIEELHLTQDELEEQLKNDRSRLQQIAQTYQVSVEEIIEWIRNEGKRLIKPESLTPWQKIERQRLLEQLQQPQRVNDDEFEDQITANRYRIQQVAQQYHVTVEEVEQWIRKEGYRIIKPAKLNEWQRKERDNLIQLIAQNDLTIQELKQKLEGDRARLQQLANQYHVAIEDMESWIIKEGQKLIAPTYLTEWQRKEHENLLNQIRQNDLTIEQLNQQLQDDRNRLQQLAQQYHVSIEDIQAWVLKEGQKLIKPVQVNEWQRKERKNLVELITQDDVIIPELRTKVEADRPRLMKLSQQYNLPVEEIEEWIVNEGQKIIRPLYLTEWQSKERDNLLQQIRQNDLTIEELKKKSEADRARLQQLAYQYHVNVQEIQDWILKEGQKLLKPVQVNEWQRREYGNLIQLITENDLTSEDFWQKIQADRPRLQQLAQQYHVTVEEVEEWILTEGQNLLEPAYLNDWQINERAKLLQQIRQNDLTIEEFRQKLQADRARLQQSASQYSVPSEKIENWILKEGQKLLKPIQVNEWQRREHVNLVELITHNDLTIRDLKQKVKADRPRFQQLAEQSNAKLEEIEEWVVNEGQRLIKPAYLTEWQIQERDDLFQQIRQNDLTIEELKRNLENDRGRLQQLAHEYQVDIQLIQDWILKEGEKLLKPVQMNEWQHKEHDNLVRLITQNDLTIQDLKQRIQVDRLRLQQLAEQYHVNVEEIEEWIITDGQSLINPAYLNEWQRKERDYLLQQIRQDHLTLEELKQQIIADRARLQQVAAQYQVPIEEIEQWIINEGRKLVKSSNGSMSEWQQHERKYLFDLAQANAITLKGFDEYLHGDNLRLETVASHYGVAVSEIIDFLRKEVQRLDMLWNYPYEIKQTRNDLFEIDSRIRQILQSITVLWITAKDGACRAEERVQAERTKEYTFSVPEENLFAIFSGFRLTPGVGLGLALHSIQNNQDDSGQKQVQVEDWNAYGQQNDKLENLEQQRQTDYMAQLTAEDLGQQQVQFEDLSWFSSSQRRLLLRLAHNRHKKRLSTPKL